MTEQFNNLSDSLWREPWVKNLLYLSFPALRGSHSIPK
jgi:hypothetical protein